MAAGGVAAAAAGTATADAFSGMACHAMVRGLDRLLCGQRRKDTGHQHANQQTDLTGFHGHTLHEVTGSTQRERQVIVDARSP